MREQFKARLTAAGKGFQISHYHTPTRSLSSFPEIMEESEPIGLSCNNINTAIVVVGNSGFPCDTLGINRTVLSKIIQGE